MAKPVGTSDKPYWSALVADGEQIKLRLMAERQYSLTPVHVDWVRFTVLRRNAPAPSVDLLFPYADGQLKDDCNGVALDDWLERGGKKGIDSRLPLQDVTSDEFAAAAEAFTIASDVSKAMGPDFSVFPEPLKGMDFYKFRWSIQLNGEECGWVGFLSSSNSPRQDSQALTIHCNLYGMACTFAASGWRYRLADLVDEYEGTLTRCDLALDFFDGLPGGIESVWQDYRDGLCNVGGRKLKFSVVGDWENKHDRSIYLGSREAGKVTNVYEKGDQLFGDKLNSDWIRAELRYGNKHRVLSVDMLRSPADFFAGASDWHASILAKADAIVVTPEPVKCIPRLQIETVEAEVSRNVRWLRNTAAASMSLAYHALSESELWSILEAQKLPGRLKKFSLSEIHRAMGSALSRVFASEEVGVPEFA